MSKVSANCKIRKKKGETELNENISALSERIKHCFQSKLNRKKGLRMRDVNQAKKDSSKFHAFKQQ